MKNPIYIEYYSHENSDCYKIDLPWTQFRKETVVLCRVDEGIEKAQQVARKVVANRLEDAFKSE